jgi:hypothetical protein
MSQGRRSGQRRAYLKKFSSTVVGVSSNIDKHYFREVASHAKAMNHRDIAFMKLFGLHSGERQGDLHARAMIGMHDPTHNAPTTRDRVLRRLAELTNNVDPTHNIELIPKTIYMLWEHHYYWLLKFDRAKQTFVVSARYPDRKRLMFAYENNFVQWKTPNPL